MTHSKKPGHEKLNLVSKYRFQCNNHSFCKESVQNDTIFLSQVLTLSCITLYIKLKLLYHVLLEKSLFVYIFDHIHSKKSGHTKKSPIKSLEKTRS